MSKRENITLTKSRINAMKPGEKLWDADVRGLHVVKGSKGAAFKFDYYFNGDRRTPSFGIVSLDMARDKAKAWRDMIADGKDPMALREEERQKGPLATLKDLEVRWEAEAKKSEDLWNEIKNGKGHLESLAKGKKRRAFSLMKPATISKYRAYWQKIHKHFGEGRPLVSISQMELVKIHTDLSVKSKSKGSRAGGPRQANLVINFLEALMKAAVLWGLVEESEKQRIDNMFANIERNQELKSKKFLMEDEIPKVYTALARLKDPAGKTKKAQKEARSLYYLVSLLLATGGRIGEYRTARLSWINWSRPVKTLHLPDTKTEGWTGGRITPLNKAGETSEVLEILKERAEEWHQDGADPDCDWLVPSPKFKGAKPLNSPYKAWRKFLKNAGVNLSLTPHSIRHTVITVAVNKAGLSLEQAGSMATHKNKNTTAGYAHTMDSSVVEARNKTISAMKAMGKEKDLQETDDNLPSFMRTEKLVHAEPPTSTQH